ncbi:hypothetical protein ACPEH7_12425 [Stenotrophomonas sp. NPDC101269]
MQQIRDAPLVMHQDHSESLGLHVAQRINCYKLPRKLPQIRSAQQVSWVGVQALVESCLAPSVSLHNIHYAKRRFVRYDASLALAGAVSVFLILVLLLRIVPLLDFIGNFEAFRDTILNKEVSAVAAFDPVRKTVGVRFLHGQVQFQQFQI